MCQCQNQSQSRYPLFARERHGETHQAMADFRASCRRWYDSNPEPRYVAQVQTRIVVRLFDLLDPEDRRELGLSPIR